MGEVIQFIPKAERERLRLIREARANYNSVSRRPISSTSSATTRQSFIPSTEPEFIRRRTVVMINSVAVFDRLCPFWN